MYQLCNISLPYFHGNGSITVYQIFPIMLALVCFVHITSLLCSNTCYGPCVKHVVSMKWPTTKYNHNHNDGQMNILTFNKDVAYRKTPPNLPNVAIDIQIFETSPINNTGPRSISF